MNKQIEVRDLLLAPLKYWIFVVLVTLLAFLFFSYNGGGKASSIYLAKTSLIFNQSGSLNQEMLISIMGSGRCTEIVAKSMNNKFNRSGLGINYKKGSNIIDITYVSIDPEQAVKTIYQVIKSVDDINEQFNFTGIKPIFRILDAPFAKPIKATKSRAQILLINTLAIFFTAIALSMFVEYILKTKR